MIPEREGTFITLDPADDAGLEVGQIVCVDANGKAVGVGDSAVRVVGIAYDVGEGTAPGSESQKVVVKRGVFRLANDSTSSVTAAEIGASCYAKDSNTVRKSPPASGFTGAVGKVLGVDDDGVWVEIR